MRVRCPQYIPSCRLGTLGENVWDGRYLEGRVRKRWQVTADAYVHRFAYSNCCGDGPVHKLVRIVQVLYHILFFHAPTISYISPITTHTHTWMVPPNVATLEEIAVWGLGINQRNLTSMALKLKAKTCNIREIDTWIFDKRSFSNAQTTQESLDKNSVHTFLSFVHKLCWIFAMNK